MLKGDPPTRAPGIVRNHEGAVLVEAVGTRVTTLTPGDQFLISCICACGRCDYCRKGMYSHCTTGSWILGSSIDGTQADFSRITFADTNRYPIPADADEEALVMLGDTLPTGFECGVLTGTGQGGGGADIVGSGSKGVRP
jgi:alcohol dehydrogenase